MKSLFAIVLILPVLSFASVGDSGWAERGNGKGFVPPSCKQVSPFKPIRPVTDDDIINTEDPRMNPECKLHEGLIGGTGQPAINN